MADVQPNKGFDNHNRNALLYRASVLLGVPSRSTCANLSTHTHTHTHTHPHNHTCTHIHAHIHAQTNTHTHGQLQKLMHAPGSRSCNRITKNNRKVKAEARGATVRRSRLAACHADLKYARRVRQITGAARPHAFSAEEVVRKHVRLAAVPCVKPASRLTCALFQPRVMTSKTHRGPLLLRTRSPTPAASAADNGDSLSMAARIYTCGCGHTGAPNACVSLFAGTCGCESTLCRS